MNASLADTGAGPLPPTLPIFPLEGALLLPRAKLPLNIFEPRYLSMVEDALAGDRLIGMIQPRETQPNPVPDEVEVYDVGCAGRISSFSESEDGRYLITLTGINRFTVKRDLGIMRGYRRFAVRYDDFPDDQAAEGGPIGNRTKLLSVTREFFEATGITGDWDTMQAVPDDALVTALAMICPLESRDKQALLECRTVAERSEFLTHLLEFRTRAGDEDSSLPRQ